jgi:hypothetical protein
VQSLEAVVQAMKANGVRVVNEKPRLGLPAWQIKPIDLVIQSNSGAATARRSVRSWDVSRSSAERTNGIS